MQKSDENQPVDPVYGIPLARADTVIPSNEGEDGMGARSMTVGRYEEIRRRLAEGRGVRREVAALRTPVRTRGSPCRQRADCRCQAGGHNRVRF